MNEIPEFARFLRGLFRTWFTERVNQLAAGLAYFGIFSLAPIIYVAFAVAGFFIDANALMDRSLVRLEASLGMEVAGLVRDLVESLNQLAQAGSAVLSVVSFFALLYAASRFFIQLQFALNRIWRAPPPQRGQAHTFIFHRTLSFLMVLVLGLVLVGLAFGYLIWAWLGSMLGLELFDTRLGMPVFVLVTTLVFALLYKILPDVATSWRSVWVGAGVASLLVTLLSAIVVWLLGSGKIGSGLAAAGAFVVILLLIYYSTQVFLFGAIVSREYSKWRGLRN